VTVEPQAGVSVGPLAEGFHVQDIATEVDVAVPADALESFLLRNGLGRPHGAPPPGADAADWSRARRTTSATPGVVGACEATVVAVVRAYGVVALVAGVGLAAVFTAADAPVRLVGGAAVAPLLALVVVIVHEAAHWSVLRLLRGGQAGAVVVGWRTCMVIHAVLPARQDRLVAAAGPGAGLLVALGSLPLTLGDFAGAYTSVVLVIVNLLGFTPLTSDGRRVFGVREEQEAW
jgi:uncharacterized membrane protein YGL010W